MIVYLGVFRAIQPSAFPTLLLQPVNIFQYGFTAVGTPRAI